MTKLTFWRHGAAHIKIRTKLLLLILTVGALCMTLFRFLWHRKWDAYYFLAEHIPSGLQVIPMPDSHFWEHLIDEAQKYDVPESEDEKDAVKAIEPFFSLADKYTSIAIYGLEDGLYRTSCFPEAMLWSEPFNTFFQMTYRWIDEDVNQNYERAVKFKNGYASVMVSFYHSSFFLVPYAVFCLFLCVALFLSVILFFVGKKLKAVVRLKDSILKMSAGDLTAAVPRAGHDEIGVLALELDGLRAALRENLLHEQEMHKSNQELIAALSHDLRTPLTILKGYLEIVRLNRSPALQTDYISRCLKKAEDIQEMTDRMFEYALVFEENGPSADNLRLLDVPLAFFLETLKEHADFLSLAGFEAKLCFPDPNSVPTAAAIADAYMLKRIFNNLFSNILKYANKKETVLITVSVSQTLFISLKNKLKTEQDEIESTKIGLKSVRKMMERMDGTLSVTIEGDFFEAGLHFPLSSKD